MKRIGLTGGIGCGKSTVVAELRSMGYSCFIADEAAADLYRDDSFVKELMQLFGDSILDDSRQVDKKAIATIVFNDKCKLTELSQLVHPRVMNDFEDWCKTKTEEKLVFFECAILYEYGLDSRMDAVVAVYLDKDERMRRLVERDKSSQEAIEARMRNQLTAEEKAMRADYVILNYEGNPRTRQIKEIVKRIIG